MKGRNQKKEFGEAREGTTGREVKVDVRVPTKGKTRTKEKM